MEQFTPFPSVRWTTTIYMASGSEQNSRTFRKFILNTIKQRQGKNVYFTTLIDLYALPADFPGKDANVRNPADPAPYVCALEEALRQSIGYYRIPEYDGRKSSAGPDIAAYIGIATIRVKCPHFHLWLVQLENLQWE